MSGFFNLTIYIMSDIIPPSSFYYESEFLDKNIFFNTVYALDIAIEQNFAEMLFYSDLSRVVYASNDYCFRKRTEMNENGLLDIPFMNYYLTDVSRDTNRSLWKNSSNVQTLANIDNYMQELGFGIKLVPVRLEYEATIFFSQDKDLQYATSKLMFQDNNETILKGILTSENGTELKNPAFMDYSFSFKPEYNENEWLESNNITSIGIDFGIDTFLIYPDTEARGILKTPQPAYTPLRVTNEIIFNFLSTKGALIKDKNLLNTQPQDLLTSYFS